MIYFRAKDKGFATPMVLMGGSVLVVLVATVILSSIGSKTNAENQHQQDNSMALAEAGIVRGMAFLAHPEKLKEAVLSSDVCNPNPTSSPKPLDVGGVEGLAVTFTPILGKNLGRLDSTGVYKDSSSRVLVEFPLIDTGEIDYGGIPGVWAKEVSGLGRIHADLMFTDQVECNSEQDLFNVPFQGENLSLPNGNQDPPLDPERVGKILGVAGIPPIPEFSVPGDSEELVCDRRGITISEDGNYLMKSVDCEVNLAPGVKANIYVDGESEIKGSKVIGSGSSSVTWHINGDLDLYGGSELGANHTNILVYGRREIELKGNSEIYGLIVAPESVVRMTGTSKIGGGVWAEKVDMGNSGQGKVYQSLSKSQIDTIKTFLPKGFLTKRKRVGAITFFRTAEVDTFTK